METTIEKLIEAIFYLGMCFERYQNYKRLEKAFSYGQSDKYHFYELES